MHRLDALLRSEALEPEVEVRLVGAFPRDAPDVPDFAVAFEGPSVAHEDTLLPRLRIAARSRHDVLTAAPRVRPAARERRLIASAAL